VSSKILKYYKTKIMEIFWDPDKKKQMYGSCLERIRRN